MIGTRISARPEGAGGRQGRRDALARPLRRAAAAWLALATLAAAGCDLNVSNPGPIEDSAVNDPNAFPALVNGAQRALSFGLNRMNHYGSIMASEMIASGATANRGHTNAVGEAYFLDPNEGVVNQKWVAVQRARWESEEAIRRLEAHLEGFESHELTARALVYAGFANRLIAENYCEAVIDGGGAEPNRVFYERADGHFTRAITVAEAAGEGDLALAARAGRATVRAHLGRWNEALADAAAVPTDFVFISPNFNTSQDENNKIVDANLSEPFRSFSVYSTWFRDYYDETGDPRTPYSSDARNPFGDGRPVPWLFEMKYRRNRSAPVNLASGREMRLLEAEGALRAGDWQGAIARINSIRTVLVSDHTGAPLAARVASSPEQAWTHLKLERAIELWIEARMLGYHREWIQEGTPGVLPDKFDTAHPGGVENAVPMRERIMCFPIPIDERRSNPNVPDS